MDEQEFEREFNGSPVRRTGFMGLQAQRGDCDGQQRACGFVPKLEEWAAAADEGLRVGGAVGARYDCGETTIA